jgi:outer membrane protein OmpA-like peptidoglycan-associated protein
VSKGKLLALTIVWLLIVGLAAVAWRLIFVPAREEAQQRDREELLEGTSGQSQYRYRVDFALDQFSGYAILRSEEFQQQLHRKQIRVNLIDDGANYRQRLQKLRSGEVDLAAFTVDALIKSSAELGELPAVIVAIIDETRGADAMVAYKNSVPNVDAMNRPETRFVLTADSPSETLARVVMTHFNLNRVADNPFVMTKGPDDTFNRYRQAETNTTDVYVLWEPFVSRILENDNMHVVVDSSRFRGYIVDVIVVSRDYLQKNHEAVRDFVGCYFAAAYRYRKEMVKLIETDAQQQKQPLSAQQAEKLVQGIRWQNTQENFAHFGLLPDVSRQHIEDMISNITRVLLRTSAIRSDPTDGRPNLFYYERILTELRRSNFHPGLAAEEIENDEVKLPALSKEEWKNLREIGELDVPALVFARGTARLTDHSYATLDDLVNTLRSWPQYYLLIRGNASRQGDLEANRQLAENRAKAAADYLVQKGIDRNRIHSEGVDPTGDTNVSFVLGEAPY